MTSKGSATRNLIVRHAYLRARLAGLEGLTIGDLAKCVRMSKSGVFAHFSSREALQLAVLSSAAERFTRKVFQPALLAKRGLPRLLALMHGWFDDIQAEGSACLILSAFCEYDDVPGAQQDVVFSWERQWHVQVERCIRLAIEVGDLPDRVDPRLFMFSLYGLALSLRHNQPLLGAASARALADRALDDLLSPMQGSK